MKIIHFKLWLVIFFISVKLQAQDSTVTKSEFHAIVNKLVNEISGLKKNNSELNEVISIQSNQADSLRARTLITEAFMNKISDSLHITVRGITSSNKQTQLQIENINQAISIRTLYWVIGILVFLFGGVGAFLMLRKRLSSNTKNLDSQINKTKNAMESAGIKLDSKLVEILQSQLSILKQERIGSSSNTESEEHKLPIKVGEEIHRMRKRIENMPQDVKGLNALTNSLKRLEEEFNDSGYEIEELLGAKYIDGMKVEARFVDNPDVPKGEEIITDVLRPQIKYKGQIIQVAKVEVGISS